ncbi:MAG: PQQ-dependent sugar dehydrogenase [Lapillicoccus sp.]
MTFAWNASTDNVGVTAYDVYHDGQLVTSVGSSTLSTNLSVVAGATWGLYVNARDAAGNVSQASATVTITPPACQSDTAPPTAPTGLTSSASGTTVTLTWTAATDNVGVRAFDIYRNGTQVGSVTGTASVPPQTTFTDSGLAASTSYSYAVTAKDAAGNVSPKSATTSVTTGSGCSQSVCGVTQVATDTDIPWGLLTLPVGHWLYAMHTSPTDNRIVRLKLNGKVLRLNPDGTVPSDNPFSNSYIWSYGHRNPQGLTFDSQGRLAGAALGAGVRQLGHGRANLIVRGGNYGWPACEGTSGTCGTSGLIAPRYTYPTSEGSCSGIAIVRDVLYVPCQRGARIYREVISGRSLTNVTAYFNGTYGRLRTVEPAPDGGLWLTTTNTATRTARRTTATRRSSAWPSGPSGAAAAAGQAPT